MREAKMTVLIGESFNRMVDILFRPFSARKWLRLTLIAILAGMLFGGNSTGGGGGDGARPAKKEAAKTSPQNTGAQVSEGSKTAGASAGQVQSPESRRRNAVIAAAIAAAAIIFIVFSIVFFTWIGARFKFVWLNSIINNTDSITEPYSRHRREGNSLFWLSLLLFTVFLVALIVLIGVVLYGMSSYGAFQKGFHWTPAVALKIFLAPSLIGIALFIAFAMFAFLIDHFLVPIMAFDGCSAGKALGRLGAVLGPNWKDCLLFILIFFLLNIVTGTAAGLIAVIVVIVLFVIAAVVFGLPYLMLWTALKAKAVFIAYAIAIGIPFVALSAMALFAASLPFAVFFRVLSLKFMLSLNAGYGPEDLERYSAKKADRLSGRASVAISMVTAFLLISILIGGVLAAIAVPNFIRARQATIENAASAHGTAAIKK